jgi:general secretion pathway protein D
MRSLVLAVLCFVSISAYAADTFKFSFTNEELGKIIDVYAKETGQKFVVDPGVRGRASIILPEKVTSEEAFNQLSEALAVNGYAISKHGDTMIVQSARMVQRNLIEIYEDKIPALKPERMVMYVATLKHIPVSTVNQEIRVLPSKDGEMAVYSQANQIIFTDWSSNINRMANLLASLDKPASPQAAKMAAENKKQMEKMRTEREKHEHKDEKSK